MWLQARLLSCVGLTLVVPLHCEAQGRFPLFERAFPEAVTAAGLSSDPGATQASGRQSGGRDIGASKLFYEKLGFTVFAGNQSQNWLIMKNCDHAIGLFQGMFDKNILTFNPAMGRRFLAAAGLVGLQAISASPAIAQVGSNGFHVVHQVSIGASPARVYETLVGQVGLWWNPEHTFSGDSKNLSIDARPGGCFCERLPNGGGVEHLRVVYVAPGEELGMSGALGPLRTSGVVGSLRWKVTRNASGTAVDLSYVVGGFIEGGFERIAPAVEGVLAEQLRRLKLFVETGKPIQETGR
jgi:hypothetical protein